MMHILPAQTSARRPEPVRTEPGAAPQTNLQTVVVVIAARNVVEEFLGELEGQGYLADRLELPLLDQLQAFVPALTRLAQALASVDALCTLAERSLSLGWCRP